VEGSAYAGSSGYLVLVIIFYIEIEKEPPQSSVVLFLSRTALLNIFVISVRRQI